MVPLTK